MKFILFQYTNGEQGGLMMGSKVQYAVIGLGRFGGAVTRELFNMGREVLAIDANEDLVREYSAYSTHAMIANTTDEATIKALGIKNFNYVIVAIGDDIQASILTTLILKEIGVENVWVKAQNEYHHKVLEKIGADRIIHPEKDMGTRIAQHLVSQHVIDYISLTEEHSMMEIKATDKLAGKTLVEVNIRQRYSCTVVAIWRNDELIMTPLPGEVIQEGDILMMIGKKSDLAKFSEKEL